MDSKRYEYTLEITVNGIAVIGPFPLEHLHCMQKFGGWNETGLPLELATSPYIPDVRLHVARWETPRWKIPRWKKWDAQKHLRPYWKWSTES